MVEDPRVVRSKAAVLAAAVLLLEEHGYSGATMEGIAARAGVAKTTVYRHWPDLDELLIDALESIIDKPPLPDTGDLRTDLVVGLQVLITGLRSASWARLLPVMCEAAERDSAVTPLARRFAARRRAALEERLEHARAAGLLRADADIDLLTSQLVGPLFYRRFVSRQALSAAMAEPIVDALLVGLAGGCRVRTARPAGTAPAGASPAGGVRPR